MQDGIIPPLYRRVIEEMQRYRKQRGISYSRLDDLAGIPDGLASKAAMLHRRTPRGAKRPSGRVVNWQTADEMLTALIGPDYRVVVLPGRALNRRRLQGRTGPETQRSLLPAAPEQLSLPL